MSTVNVGKCTSHMDPTWRIIPVTKWLITMVSKSPKDRVIPLPNGLNGL